jgi:hypothetical protein
MNVKRGNEIGHPSSIYIWDIINTAENCFGFLDWRLSLGEPYFTSARTTAAQSSREISKRITLLSDDEFRGEGPAIVAHPDGYWKYYEQEFLIDRETIVKMPFGPVILYIDGIKETAINFPRSMLGYLINTFERGEEPMETRGKHGYSAVSGWKAYARWMQSFTVPLPDMQHQYLNEIIELIGERRKFFSYFWYRLSEMLDNELERDFALVLAKRYYDTISPISKMNNQGASYDLVKEAYFIEQKALPTYKRIKLYLDGKL